MPIQLKRVDPFEWREAILEFFWKLQIWPYETKDDYLRNWEWRYKPIPESAPAVWVAIDGNDVIGHIAVNFRHLCFNGHAVRAGVPGNFRVDPSHGNVTTGAALAGVPRAMVNFGEIDILLGYGNRIAHSMLVRLGSRDFGAMRQYWDVRQWAPILGRRFVGGAMFAPIASIAARIRNAKYKRRLSSSAKELVARNLSVQEALSIDRSHWASSASFVSNGSTAYIANRFLNSPFDSYRVIGITNPDTHQIEGLVVTEGTARVNVLECTVNESILSEVEAVDLAINAITTAESVVVPLLPQTKLAEDFAAAGYFTRSAAAHDTIAYTRWSVYWKPTHPLASLFANTRMWKLWYGWSHH